MSIPILLQDDVSIKLEELPAAITEVRRHVDALSARLETAEAPSRSALLACAKAAEVIALEIANLNAALGFEGIVVSLGQWISRETVLSNIKNGVFIYRVKHALDFYDIMSMFINDVNEILVDDIVEDGYLLEGIQYRVAGVNEEGRMTIEVVASAAEYQQVVE